MRDSSTPIDVPVGYPTAVLYLDESGSKTSGGRFFTVAAVKVRNPGAFQRAIKAVRDKTAYDSEFKFSEITRGALPAYHALIDTIEESDAHLAACVVDSSAYNPFTGTSKPNWMVHADVAAQLLVGCINRRELATVLLDGISTPPGCSLEDQVKSLVNRRLRATSVVGAVCLDSRSNDGLQVADLLAGAIGYDRRFAIAGASTTSNKGKIARRLQAAFGISNFDDQRSPRVNIATYRGRSTSRGLRVVEGIPRQGLSTA